MSKNKERHGSGSISIQTCHWTFGESLLPLTAGPPLSHKEPDSISEAASKSKILLFQRQVLCTTSILT